MKRALTVMMIVLALTAFLIGSAQATWYTSKVIECGVASSGQYFFKVQDATTFTTATYFQLDPNNTNLLKQWYAALLTAWSTGGNVYFDASGNTAWSTVYGLSVQN